VGTAKSFSGVERQHPIIRSSDHPILPVDGGGETDIAQFRAEHLIRRSPRIGMSPLRRVRALPLAFALPFLPACALSIGSGPDAREATRPKSEVAAPVQGGFAIARRPGTTIKLNPAWIDPATLEKIPVVPEGKTSAEPADLPPIEVLPVDRAPNPDDPLVAVLKAHLEGRPDAALSLLSGFDKPNQDLLQQLMPALVKASKVNPALADPKELATIAGPFAAVANLLNKRAPLTIDKAVFCRSVTNFGRYDPLMQNAVLRPGTTNIIYFEIGNVASEPTNQNGIDGYLTKLLCTWQIRDGNDRPLILIGKSKESKDERLQQIDPKMDFSLSPLRDYYLQLVFNAPLTPGNYSVHFKVRDSITGREVARSLPFRVP